MRSTSTSRYVPRARAGRDGHTHDLTKPARTGYRITLSDGWLDDPDAMYGVAAHELGHVAGRHREGRPRAMGVVACVLVMPSAW